MASECSFDVVSKVDFQEVKNATEHSLKEIKQRYDFKGSVSNIELSGTDKIILTSDDEIKLKAVIDVLQSKLFKRGVSIRSLTYGKIQQASKGTVRQEITISQGIPQDKAKIFVNGIKEKKIQSPSLYPGRSVESFRQRQRYSTRSYCLHSPGTKSS